MPELISREDLLHTLDSVSLGLALNETVEQSTCLVFRGGRVTAYNGEVCVSAPSPFGSFEGAFKAKNTLDLLRKISDTKLGYKQGDGRLVITGRKKYIKVRVQQEILMPLDQVDTPKDTDWKPLPENFLDAVTLVRVCAAKVDTTFYRTCVNIHPKWVEACSSYQLARYRLRTGVPAPILVRRDSIGLVTSLGVNEIASTDAWLHFRSPSGLIFSCRKFLDDYPDLTNYLNVGQGDVIEFPKGLEKVVECASIPSSENTDANRIRVEVQPGKPTGKFRLRGIGVNVEEYSEYKDCAYEGKPLVFLISPEILGELAKKHTTAEVVETPNGGRLKIASERWVYVACLGIPSQGQETQEEEVEVEEELPTEEVSGEEVEVASSEGSEEAF